MFSLPLIAETQFALYISGSLSGQYQQSTPDGLVTGSYAVSPAFTISPYTLPAVFVKAGKFKSIDPFTHIFEGELMVSIMSQIDDDQNVMVTHDSIVQQVYSILSDADAIKAGVNAANFELWGIVPTEYDHELVQKEKSRELATVLGFTINCQNLGVSV
jgi:hypothetical protein